MKMLYLLVDFFTVIVPLLFSFHPKINFHKTWGAFFKANILVAVLFLLWDAAFTQWNVWGFTPRYVSGLYVFNLPVEEGLFFICIPYACVFTYHCLTKFYNLAWPARAENIFCLLLSATLLALGVLFLDRLYTASAFISTALVCLLLKFVFRINWFGKSITVYALLLIPFFMVNGILTGTGLEQPVVWYNNAENLGFRLLTIPVEDVFYGYELIALNLFFYHLFLKSPAKEKAQQDTRSSGADDKPLPHKSKTQLAANAK